MFIRSTLLAPYRDLLHGFTDRSHGNIAFHVGDAQKNVHANQSRLAEAFGYERQRLVHMKQLHSDRIVTVGEQEGYASPPECDAVITDESERPLMVMVADCTPILLYDPLQKVVAAVHAGRTGALSNISGKTVERMRETFGCRGEDLLAVLGPSIAACCYEVGETIAEEAAGGGHAHAVKERGGRYFLDINAIIRRQFLEAGIASEHIETMPHCTACENGRFFSYRADRQATGRFAGVIMLKAD